MKSVYNRTAGFRLLGTESRAIRMERCVGRDDPDSSLGFAALIAARIARIQHKLKLELAFSGDANTGKKLRNNPRNQRAAIDDVAINHYVHGAEREQFEYDRCITDWKLKRGFERNERVTPPRELGTGSGRRAAR